MKDDIMLAKTDERPALPDRGWAPGNYICKCCSCKEQFIGEKRAFTCAECAHTGTPCEKAMRFTKELLSQYWDSGMCGFEGSDIWELAQKYGVITKVPGGFDPAKHESDYDAEPGDDWFQTHPAIQAAK